MLFGPKMGGSRQPVSFSSVYAIPREMLQYNLSSPNHEFRHPSEDVGPCLARPSDCAILRQNEYHSASVYKKRSANLSHCRPSWRLPHASQSASSRTRRIRCPTSPPENMSGATPRIPGAQCVFFVNKLPRRDSHLCVDCKLSPEPLSDLVLDW